MKKFIFAIAIIALCCFSQAAAQPAVPKDFTILAFECKISYTYPAIPNGCAAEALVELINKKHAPLLLNFIAYNKYDRAIGATAINDTENPEFFKQYGDTTFFAIQRLYLIFDVPWQQCSYFEVRVWPEAGYPTNKSNKEK